MCLFHRSLQRYQSITSNRKKYTLSTGASLQKKHTLSTGAPSQKQKNSTHFQRASLHKKEAHFFNGHLFTKIKKRRSILELLSAQQQQCPCVESNGSPQNRQQSKALLIIYISISSSSRHTAHTTHTHLKTKALEARAHDLR